jgi:hypothetical protein
MKLPLTLKLLGRVTAPAFEIVRLGTAETPVRSMVPEDLLTVVVMVLASEPALRVNV